MAQQLRARGIATSGQGRRCVGRVARTDVDSEHRGDFVRVVTRGEPASQVFGYAGVLVERGASAFSDSPTINEFDSLEFLKDGHVASMELTTGLVHTLYRPESRHNFLFATERCNSSCLMCSQPPRDLDDHEADAELRRIIELIPDSPEHLGISGGEPTLLGEGLIRVLGTLAYRLPTTAVTMLSNGRGYADESFVARVAAVKHPRLLTSVPLHGDTAALHDYVAQVRGAFDETIQGLYNATRVGLATELRVVLHRVTAPRLTRIVEFAYRNLPFVQHIALMGLEDTGYARAHRDLLSIDPVDFSAELEKAVEFCFVRRVPVSIYNLPLCILPRSTWSFSRQSISDYKNAFLEQCSGCSQQAHCAGFFETSEASLSRAIQALP